jgi:hypothetical protein
MELERCVSSPAAVLFSPKFDEIHAIWFLEGSQKPATLAFRVLNSAEFEQIRAIQKPKCMKQLEIRASRVLKSAGGSVIECFYFLVGMDSHITGRFRF